MDKYERKARIYPAIVAMVIPGIFIAWVFRDVLPIIKELQGGVFYLLEGIIVPALIFSAFGYFMRNLFRSTSKLIFQIPFFKEDESYMPTTNYLLWDNEFFSKEKKKRIYSKILNKYGVNIPIGHVKKKDDPAVRKKIAEAVRLIRVDFRKKGNNDSIVLDYNIQFGMYRNFLGGSIYSCLLIAGTILMNAFYSFTNEWISSILVIVVQVFLIAASIIALKIAASDYAKYLIDYFDTHM